MFDIPSILNDFLQIAITGDHCLYLSETHLLCLRRVNTPVAEPRTSSSFCRADLTMRSKLSALEDFFGGFPEDDNGINSSIIAEDDTVIDLISLCASKLNLGVAIPIISSYRQTTNYHIHSELDTIAPATHPDPRLAIRQATTQELGINSNSYKIAHWIMVSCTNLPKKNNHLSDY